MEKLLTIVIPAYNMEKYLERCLNSLIIEEILSKYLEVIIINDGSKDKTLEIANQFVNKYPKLFISIDKANGNWGSCINISTNYAHGRYVLILDADDWLETKELKKFINLLLNNEETDIVFFNNNIVYGNTKYPQNHSVLKQCKTYYITDFIDKTIPFSFFCHCIALNLEILKRIKLQEGIPYCDVELNIYMFNYIHSFKYFDILLYNYVVDRPGQSIEINSYKKNISAIEKITTRYLKEKSSNECILYWQRLAILPLLQKYYEINLLYKTTIPQFMNFILIHRQICTDKKLYELILNTKYIKIKFIDLWDKYKCRILLRLLPHIKTLKEKAYTLMNK